MHFIPSLPSRHLPVLETLEQGVKYVKVNNKDTRRHWRRSGVFIVNFEDISHLVLVCVSIVNFEQENAGWKKLVKQNYPEWFDRDIADEIKNCDNPKIFILRQDINYRK